MRIVLVFLTLFLVGPLWAAPVLLVMGDSLSAGYGITRNAGWVSLLARRLVERQTDWRVVNASVSGETTSGGRTRLPALLSRHQPALLILELGANDGLRGLSAKQTSDNLVAMIELARRQGARVLLVGMQLPPNYGPRYTQEFRALYKQVATRTQVRRVPFLLEGMAANPALFQADGLHPTAEAQPILLENVWLQLAPMLTDH